MPNRKLPDNLYIFPTIKKSKAAEVVDNKDKSEPEDFRVLETTIAFAITGQQLLSPIIHRCLTCILFSGKIGLRLLVWTVLKLEKLIFKSTIGLVDFVDYMCCVLTRKIHGL